MTTTNAELNTQNNAWFGSKISIICCELSGAPRPPSEPPIRGSASAPCWETSVLQTLCAPIPPHSGYATGVQVFIEAMTKVQTAYRETARRCSVQRNRAMRCGAEGPRDARACTETARRHVVQRDRATPPVSETPRDATWCRGTARCYSVQRCHVVRRDRATSRRADGPRDVTSCSGTARR